MLPHIFSLLHWKKNIYKCLLSDCNFSSFAETKRNKIYNTILKGKQTKQRSTARYPSQKIAVFVFSFFSFVFINFIIVLYAPELFGKKWNKIRKSNNNNNHKIFIYFVRISKFYFLFRDFFLFSFFLINIKIFFL